jgi:hypothetical protein
MLYGPYISTENCFFSNTQDLFIIVIKVELFNHINNALLTSTLGGLQNYSWELDHPSI